MHVLLVLRRTFSLPRKDPGEMGILFPEGLQVYSHTVTSCFIQYVRFIWPGTAGWTCLEQVIEDSSALLQSRQAASCLQVTESFLWTVNLLLCNQLGISEVLKRVAS